MKHHSEKALRKKKALEAKRKAVEEERKRAAKKRVVKYSLIAVAVVLAVLAVSRVKTPQSDDFPITTPIHWHAKLAVYLCGKYKDLSSFGRAGMAGNSLTHTHGDNTVHMEGVVRRRSDLTLSNFFKAVGIPFSKDKLFNYSNGDLCDGRPGKVKVLVNRKLVEDFEKYSLIDGDVVEVRFE